MGSVLLFLGGDVMSGRGIDQILPHPSAPRLHEPWVHDAREYRALAEAAHGPIPHPVNPSYPWGDALALLDAAAPRYRIINLETALTRSDDFWPGKAIHYRMHPANAGCLSAAAIDVCMLANNHVLDWGHAGLQETLHTLDDIGIHHAGAGADAAAAAAPVVLPLRDGRLLLLACATADSGVAADWSVGPGQAGLNVLTLDDAGLERIANQVASFRRRGDRVVLSIHWGSNWGYHVPAAHIAFAHRLIDEVGVDLIYGHSSHHPRPIEVFRGHLVLYGCGDLLNDYEGIRGYEQFRGDLALLYLPELGADGSLCSLRMLPLRIRHFRLGGAPAADVRWLAQTLTAVCRPFATRLERDGESGLRLRW